MTHREVYRPWGTYDSIDQGPRYRVKRITVKPGAKLSVPMHHHRAEHWVVVSGTAKVTNGEDTILVPENQSTYIRIGRHDLCGTHRPVGPQQEELREACRREVANGQTTWAR
jgi:mannose-6-phosphate isomerase-like protein (cupin superfamily)